MLGDRAVVALSDRDGAAVISSHPSSGGGADSLPPGAQEALQRALREQKLQQWHQGGEAAVICPLSAGRRALGALVLLGRRGQFDGARLALVREVADRASIAMENARLYSAVQDADRRKNEFLAMLAHELRNPLAPIRNAVHIMQSADVPATTLTWARDVISRQADHMARLIDDLLDVSRIVQGKVVVKPERLMLATLIERSAESSMPKLDARKQKLAIELPAQPVELDGDSARLAQVLSQPDATTPPSSRRPAAASSCAPRSRRARCRSA